MVISSCSNFVADVAPYQFAMFGVVFTKLPSRLRKFERVASCVVVSVSSRSSL